MDGEISAEELKELLDADAEVRVVDIRSADAFTRNHIPGSVNVPFEQLTERIEELAEADRVVTVCPHGKASVQAARLIDSFEGFEGRVDSLSSGMEGWPYGKESGRESADEADEADADAPF